MAGPPGQGAQKPLSVPADAQVGHGPHPRQNPQPGEAHIGHRPEQPEVGEVVGHGPYAGVEPAQLPLVRPHGEAQTGEGGEQHQGQVRPPGDLIGGGGGQNGQGQGQPQKQEVGEHIVRPGKDGADEPQTDGEPHRHGEGGSQHRPGQQGQQAHPRHGVGRDRRVHEHVHPAAAGAVQLEDGEQGEQNAAPHAARQGRVGQIQGEHGVGVGGLVEDETRRGRDRRQQDHEPGQAAAQQPPQLQGKQPDRFHWTASREMR